MKLWTRIFCSTLCFFVLAWVAAAEKIVIKGSNTFGESLGPRLIDEYVKLNPETSIDLETKGSASGFAALLAGECDIASSSRPANEDETRLARSREIKMTSSTIGYYGVAVVVNEKNPLTNLKDSDVRDIFTGAATSWRSFGGEEEPIRVFIRDPVSGTHLGFRELAMENKPYAGSAVPLKSYEEIVDAVRKDPYAIGYVGMNHASDEGLHALRINGIRFTADNVNDQAYPYARQLRLYTRRGDEAKPARRFIRFVQSKIGQNILKEMGYVGRFESRLSLPPVDGN